LTASSGVSLNHKNGVIFCIVIFYDYIPLMSNIFS
jgi:hypothetical protein